MFKKLIKVATPPFLLPIEAASAIIKDKENRYLLLKRSKLSKVYPRYWQLPEGKIKYGENPKLALVRELEEELGVKYSLRDISFIKKQRILVKKFGIPLLYIDRYLYSCKAPATILLSKEHQDYGYFKLHEVKKLNNKLPELLKLLKASI